MRLGGDPVGKWGLALLTAAGIAGVVLAVHGWSGWRPAAAPALAGSSVASSSPAPKATTRAPAPARRSASRAPSASPAPSGTSGPLLSSEPYARVSFRVWPGPMTAAAKQALIGLSVRVRKVASGLSVTAGVAGQAPGSPRVYPGGARVYVVEASLGDDSGNSDYSLGDDGLVVTSRQGRIVQ
ncbi:MAG: hypothetical protein LBI49_11165 [Nocardiopsaceae bacterium]|jgi:hypothetical protein|nr:hypothetical protein [Nocardiopsaceae bacterium]